jgi:hypothetical protein
MAETRTTAETTTNTVEVIITVMTVKSGDGSNVTNTAAKHERPSRVCLGERNDDWCLSLDDEETKEQEKAEQ